jgi:glycerol-3-phosphate cytidylyltransferase-like family protein
MQTIRRVYIPGVWDHLIVGVCSDEMCVKTKDKAPAIIDKWRREVIDNLKFVDSSIIYRDLDYFGMVQTLGAEVFAVGEEFGYLPEHQEALKKFTEHGTEIVYIPRYQGISTTDIKKKILKTNL